MLKSKKLLILGGLILLFVSISSYLLVAKSDKSNEPALQSTAKSEEEISNLIAKSDRFDDLAGIANSSDANVKLQASLDFARNTDNDTTSRLDSYRLCIQSAMELKDTSTQGSCFNEALALAKTLQKETDKTFWADYINEVNSGVVNNGSETDDSSQ